MTGIVVSVGTDHHPFDRLIAWTDRWARQHPDVDVFVQYGTSSGPSVARGQDLLPHGDLGSRMREAAAVVTHGGPATIAEARDAGHVPVVVPRRPELGEHVDDHQIRFCTHLVERGLIDLPHDEAAFTSAVVAAMGRPRLEGGSHEDVLDTARVVETLVARLLATPRRRRWPGRPRQDVR